MHAPRYSSEVEWPRTARHPRRKVKLREVSAHDAVLQREGSSETASAEPTTRWIETTICAGPFVAPSDRLFGAAEEINMKTAPDNIHDQIKERRNQEIRREHTEPHVRDRTRQELQCYEQPHDGRRAAAASQHILKGRRSRQTLLRPGQNARRGVERTGTGRALAQPYADSHRRMGAGVRPSPLGNDRCRPDDMSVPAAMSDRASDA
ncbi:hypothetical protein EDB89DRAFT_1910584 [Lactarius sanguifluus]|nr:hypothetical protein EDB89DRAFT_1910584 [Lactarius sanguifluus]